MFQEHGEYFKSKTVLINLVFVMNQFNKKYHKAHFLNSKSNLMINKHMDLWNKISRSYDNNNSVVKMISI
jgi:hypothetical protein